MSTVVTSLAGDTIDAICWRELARTRDVTEQVLALNPGLAALGPILPPGTPVTLPDTADMAPAVRETINLWD